VIALRCGALLYTGMAKKQPWAFHPLTADRWSDFETLFGEKGACGGCWCMHWRLRGKAFDEGKGAKNKQAMKKLVASGAEPGILAYDSDRPIGWCAVAPREEYARLENSRSLQPIDDTPVWSIVCFFVSKDYRGQGVTSALAEAAVRFAKERGGRMVEGYPYDYRGKAALPPPFVYTGLIQAFEKAGFKEVARPSKTRAIMRKKS
jgi:GNAT superfamily N-acetyltransferase